ncbi:S1C family serine protease [Singulisphaera sp. PoT]|uniref:S1C family serine protease n=1 Tax=Singulisphaera sp. PoT TaxID=3411797 RepID=UPI003BF616A4
MSRSATSLVLLATLNLGVLLGVVLDRGGRFVSAQATPGNRSGAARIVAIPAASREAVQTKAGDEGDLYKKLERQYEQFEQVNRTFELVSEAVSPAVVHIVAQKTGRNEEVPHMRRYEETGSGVIVRSDRGRQLYVLTNNHVIEGAKPEKINIFLKDGRAIRPERAWLDAKADIAVLSLGREDLPAARLGDSDAVNVGSWVLALGSPFGLMHSVSQGIISARGRHMDELQDVENQDFLQTDAAINPGNSGGPLVNMKGEVIGINNSIASNGGGNEGVGFSIPINLARWIMNQLLHNGRVTRGALGIDLHPEFRPEDALARGLDRPRGAWVDVVRPFMPAAQAGMHDGDVIVQFRGVEVQDLNHLINLVSMATVGESVDVIVLRDKKRLTLRVTVGDRDRTVVQSGPAEEAAQHADRDGRRRAPASTGSPREHLVVCDGPRVDHAR